MTLYVGQVVSEGLQLALLGMAERTKAQERGLDLHPFISNDDNVSYGDLYNQAMEWHWITFPEAWFLQC